MCKIFSSVFWVGVICYFGCNFLQFLVSKIYFYYLVCLKNFNLPYEVSYPLLNMVKCDSRCYRALKKLVRVSLGGINMGFTKVKNKVKTEYWRKALPKKRDINTGQVAEFLKQTSSLPFLDIEIKLLVIASTSVSIEKRAASIMFSDFYITISK